MDPQNHMQIESDFNSLAGVASLVSTIGNDASMRLRDVEVTPIGERLVLRNRKTGATLLSNSFGVLILDGIRDGCDVGTISRRLVRYFNDAGEANVFIQETVRSWTHAGLFGAPSQRPIVASETRASLMYEACFTVGSRQFRFLSESAEVFGDVASLMADYRAKSLPKQAIATISVLSTTAGHEVYLDDTAVWRPGSADEARFLVIQTALSVLAGPENVSAVFHAAAVVRDDEALLLAGPSGKGKTTLALLLSRHGWNFAGDDLIALHRDGRRIVALPLAAHFKSANLSEVEDGTARVAFHIERQGGYAWPLRTALSGNLFSVSAIVFPQYQPESEFLATAVAPEAALQYLLKTGTEIVPSSGSVRPLARLLDSIPTQSWTYGRNNDAVAAANNIFSRNRIKDKL